MKTLNYVKIVLLLVLTISISSCEIEDDYNTDERLCSKYWTETYYTEGGEFCTHELIFYLDGGGEENFVYQLDDSYGKVLSEVKQTFTWDWADYTMRGLVLEYAPNDFLYFDNVIVGDHELSGVFDGTAVTFWD
jgi:hypothetical protein